MSDAYSIWEFVNLVTGETKFVTYGRLEEYLLHLTPEERDGITKMRLRVVSL
jgi:hypothetical protein